MTNTNSNDLLKKRMTSPLINKDPNASLPSEMPMTITLDQVHVSDVLPRMKKNESYNDLKESIRSSGLDQAPIITKRPGDDFYIIAKGGNTRLEILKELYEETADPAFFRFNCVYQKWQSESKSIVGHLKENGLRSDYTFIEKSLGVSKLKSIYESDLNKSLSYRELSSKLKEDGYPISHVLLSKMINTVELLYPFIPEIFKAGLSRNNAEKILQLRTTCEKKWKDSDIDELKSRDFNDEFGLILTQFDLSPEIFSYERLQDEVLGHFSTLFKISYDDLNFDLLSSKKIDDNDNKVDKEKNENDKPNIIEDDFKDNNTNTNTSYEELEHGEKNEDDSDIKKNINVFSLKISYEDNISQESIFKIIDGTIDEIKNNVNFEENQDLNNFLDSLTNESVMGGNTHLNIDILFDSNIDDFVLVRIFKLIKLIKLLKEKY
ncbi:hypothetical protein GAPWK_2708 [Gilliamella apicola]|jgi:integrating conjugative element, PFGI_1 class, ParB family protein|uniref:ParB family protein n=1 Tax=Gilliamella apicola TaxID=1196095 RepID=UPI00042F2F8D|nr:ParB family protein [Gilliamella apicola]AHN27281.1 hypothetical protein GAPWK_2708 [Gilliamella apicola]PXV96554.1 ParB family protein of integrating conjugative element (PFGI_1 class) [Gilliamella apicola]